MRNRDDKPYNQDGETNDNADGFNDINQSQHLLTHKFQPFWSLQTKLDGTEPFTVEGL